MNISTPICLHSGDQLNNECIVRVKEVGEEEEGKGRGKEERRRGEERTEEEGKGRGEGGKVPCEQHRKDHLSLLISAKRDVISAYGAHMWKKAKEGKKSINQSK